MSNSSRSKKVLNDIRQETVGHIEVYFISSVSKDRVIEFFVRDVGKQILMSKQK